MLENKKCSRRIWSMSNHFIHFIAAPFCEAYQKFPLKRRIYSTHLTTECINIEKALESGIKVCCIKDSESIFIYSLLLCSVVVVFIAFITHYFQRVFQC